MVEYSGSRTFRFQDAWRVPDFRFVMRWDIFDAFLELYDIRVYPFSNCEQNIFLVFKCFFQKHNISFPAILLPFPILAISLPPLSKRHQIEQVPFDDVRRDFWDANEHALAYSSFSPPPVSSLLTPTHIYIMTYMNMIYTYAHINKYANIQKYVQTYAHICIYIYSKNVCKCVETSHRNTPGTTHSPNPIRKYGPTHSPNPIYKYVYIRISLSIHAHISSNTYRACVCVYVYVCVCVCMRVCVCVCVCMFMCLCGVCVGGMWLGGVVSMSVCVFVRDCVRECIHMCVYICQCIWLYICLCVCVNTYTCIYKYIYIYIRIHICIFMFISIYWKV